MLVPNYFYVPNTIEHKSTGLSCVVRNMQFLRERYETTGHMFDVGHDVSWARNDRVFSRYWRTELDDRADMVKELIMIRDGVLSGSVDFTPEDVQTLITLLSAD